MILNFIAMKKIKLLIVVSTSIFLLTSCVSNQKSREAITWKERYNALEADYADLQQWKTTWEQRYLSLTEANAKLRTEKLARRDLPAEKQENAPASAQVETKHEELNSLILQHRKAIVGLKQEVATAMKEFTPDELGIDIQNGRLYVSLSDKLLFPTGSDEVDKRGKEAVVMLAKVLSKDNAEVIIEGHTDKVPIRNARNKDNWDLSLHRAASITRILTENGISPERIIASGRGEYYPLAENETNEGRVQNRRTEIILAPNSENLWKMIGDDQSMSLLQEK
jgi:chemotaxis protein MotB